MWYVKDNIFHIFHIFNFSAKQIFGDVKLQSNFFKQPCFNLHILSLHQIRLTLRKSFIFIDKSSIFFFFLTISVQIVICSKTSFVIM